MFMGDGLSFVHARAISKANRRGAAVICTAHGVLGGVHGWGAGRHTLGGLEQHSVGEQEDLEGQFL